MFGNLGVEICIQGRLGLTPRDFGVSFRFARPGNHSWQLPQCMLCEDYPCPSGPNEEKHQHAQDPSAKRVQTGCAEIHIGHMPIRCTLTYRFF